MTLGPVMLDVAGTELTSEDREVLRHPAVGGVILFTRNYHDPEQLTHLVNSIRALREDHLLIAVDHEGGRVQRFHEGFTKLPPMRNLGEMYNKNPQAAKQITRDIAWLMAAELRSVGVDFSFAPVVDIGYGKSSVIGDRAFHSSPEVVYELGFAYCSGMREAGMASVAKHFPGHGAVREDSHTDIPHDQRDWEKIYEHDIRPFRLLIEDNLTAIMPAHVIYDRIDERPAGFSALWLKTILREQLKFNGVIFSDDLNMHGASVAGPRYADRSAAAMGAGCDMVLICNNRPAAIEILHATGPIHPESQARLSRMHGRHPITRQQLQHMSRWVLAAEKCRQYVDNPNLELDV